MKDDEKLIERLSNLVAHWTKRAEENEDDSSMNAYCRGHADAAQATLEWLDTYRDTREKTHHKN